MELAIEQVKSGWDFVGLIDGSDWIGVSPICLIELLMWPIGDFVRPNDRIESHRTEFFDWLIGSVTSPTVQWELRLDTGFLAESDRPIGFAISHLCPRV